MLQVPLPLQASRSSGPLPTLGLAPVAVKKTTPDRHNLMTGYIDTNAEDPISATVSNLPDGATYDVIVYIKGGVNNKGGDYTIGDQVLSHTDTAPSMAILSMENSVTTLSSR